ncbi:transposase [Gemmiger formicilis]|uniref:transposase n=1 Tax=Gemmiger formicilis TaxID=745368 RepID=UPI00399BD3FD
MARNQRKYNTEYKVQAVKLSNEIGSSKAAVELGIPVDTLYGWVKAAKEGRLDIGGGAHTPQTAMSLAEELNGKHIQHNVHAVSHKRFCRHKAEKVVDSSFGAF